MPVYDYEAAEGERGCPACQRGFEVRHGMTESGPTTCPRCGCKVIRKITAPGLVTKWNEKALLSDNNLKRHGFKKLRNEGDGKFRVT